MKVGTIRRTRDCIMRYGGFASRTRAPRERTLPTDHSHAALAGTPVQPANISVTRRRSARPSPSSSFTQAHQTPAATPRGGRQETTIALT
jgi:hypothetical protein